MRAMRGIQHKDKKRVKDLMLMLSLNETISQLDMANSVCWSGHVLMGRKSCLVKGIRL